MSKNLHIAFFAYLESSYASINAIFGIFSKFRIDIDKQILKNIFFQNEKLSWQKSKNIFLGNFRKILTENMFFLRVQKNSTLKKKFSVRIFSKISENFQKKSKKIFFDFCQENFSFWKNIFFNIFLSMSIRNLLKIPKITLRRACDECKYTKNANYDEWNEFYRILWSCYV